MEMIERDAHPVCTVVVTYRPAASVLNNVVRIARQAAKLIVIDNGSGPQFQPLLAEIEKQRNALLIRNSKNLGIAAALNQGVQWALAEGFEWIATFDQDSVISEGFFGHQFAALAKCALPERVALISPRIV